MSGTCETIRALLGARHDGELDRARAGAVDRHAAACADCRAELEALRHLSSAAARLRAESPPPDLAARVRADVECESEHAGRAAARVAAVAALVLSTASAYAVGLWHGRARAGAEDPELVDALPPEPAPPPIPSDGDAVRAARSLLADLALVDGVPEPVRAPLLEAQLAHFGLDRWARARVESGPVGEVAALVRRLDEAIDLGAPPDELAALRGSVERPGLWRVPPGAGARGPGTGSPENGSPETGSPEVDRLVDRLAPELELETRRSIGRWISAKDSWVRRGDDLEPLVELLGALGEELSGSERAPSAFVLPDLAALEAEIEWTIEPDGTRRGVLHRESDGPGGAGVFHLEVREVESIPRSD